jgi:hypothetical protein
MIWAFPMEQQNAAMILASSRILVIFIFMGLMGMNPFWGLLFRPAATARWPVGNLVQMEARNSSLHQFAACPSRKPAS